MGECGLRNGEYQAFCPVHGARNTDNSSQPLLSSYRQADLTASGRFSEVEVQDIIRSHKLVLGRWVDAVKAARSIAIRQVVEAGLRQAFLLSEVDYSLPDSDDSDETLPAVETSDTDEASADEASDTDDTPADSREGRSVAELKAIDALILRTSREDAARLDLENSKAVEDPVPSFIKKLFMGARVHAEEQFTKFGFRAVMAPPPPAGTSSTRGVKRTNEDILKLYDVAYRSIMGEDTADDKEVVEHEKKRRRLVTPPPPLPRLKAEKETEPSQHTQEYLAQVVPLDSSSRDPSFNANISDDDTGFAVFRTTRSEAARAAALAPAAGSDEGSTDDEMATEAGSEDAE